MTEKKTENCRENVNINEAYADANRKLFAQAGIFSVNILGSPGAGKTSLLEKILNHLGNFMKAAVIEGDLATARDAQRIAECKVPVVQINTDQQSHLDAKMINQVLPGFHLDYIDLIFIENVGSLILSADMDLGEDLKILIMSAADDQDTPAKYQAAFKGADIIVLNKTDLLPDLALDLSRLKSEILEINPDLSIFETCCHHGDVQGIDTLADYLAELAQKKKARLGR